MLARQCPNSSRAGKYVELLKISIYEIIGTHRVRFLLLWYGLNLGFPHLKRILSEKYSFPKHDYSTLNYINIILLRYKKVFGPKYHNIWIRQYRPALHFDKNHRCMGHISKQNHQDLQNMWPTNVVFQTLSLTTQTPPSCVWVSCLLRALNPTAAVRQQFLLWSCMIMISLQITERGFFKKI